MPDDFPPLLLDDDDVQNDPDLAWYSDKGSGGYHLPFGTHAGRTVNEVPESYLVWTKTHLKGRYGVHRSVTRTLGAIEAFVEGLEGCLDEWFADFIVPCGVHHRGKTIRRCSDRAWLSWVVGRDRVRRSHPLFVQAVHIWLGSKTRLKASVDPTTFLPPARYHADLRESVAHKGQSMPGEGDFTEYDIESPRANSDHADSDASITDPEDEEDHYSKPCSSDGYLPPSRGSSRNFVVADDRVSASTDDSAYGELERAESLLRSAQKRRRRSSDGKGQDSPSKRRARPRHRSSSSPIRHLRQASPSGSRASSSSLARPPSRRRRRPSAPDNGSPAHYTRSQARIAQEHESPAPRTRARTLTASQDAVDAVDAAASSTGVPGAKYANAGRTGYAGATLSANGLAGWSASASAARKGAIRTYGRRALTLSERLARLVDPPTPEPDGAGAQEEAGDAHMYEREEEEEEEEEEEIIGAGEKTEKADASGRERVADYVPDSEGEEASRNESTPSVGEIDQHRGVDDPTASGDHARTRKEDGRRLVFSHVELPVPTRHRQSSPPLPTPAPRRSLRAERTDSASHIGGLSPSSRAADQALSSQATSPRLIFSHVEIPSPSSRNASVESSRVSRRGINPRDERSSALDSTSRMRRRQSAPEALRPSSTMRMTRAAARRHSPPPTASRSSSPSVARSSCSRSPQRMTSSPPRSRSTTPPAPDKRSPSTAVHHIVGSRKRRSVSLPGAPREKKRAKVEVVDSMPRQTRSAARLAQSVSAFPGSQASARPIPIFSLLTEDEEVEDSEGEATITISAGVRGGPAAKSTRNPMASASAPVADPFSRAVDRLRSRASSRKSSASSSAANNPRSSATKIASSSTAVASSSFVGSRPPSAPRPSAASADAAPDTTGLRARFPNMTSSVLAARMRGVVEEVPRNPTPEGEWEWYLDEFDMLVKRPVVKEEPSRASASKERDKGKGRALVQDVPPAPRRHPPTRMS